MKRKLILSFGVMCVIMAVAVVALGGKLMSYRSDNDVAMQTVTDSAGRDVEIPVHPKRVIVLNASNIDLYVAAGGAENIVGKASSQAYSETVLEATKNAKDCGIIHNPNVETILNLQPDLIIGTNVPFHQALSPILATAGVPVYLNSLSNFDDIYGSLEFFGKLTNHENKAEAQIEKMKKEYQDLVASVQGKVSPKSIIIFGNPESFSMATSKTFTGELVQKLGGSNLADSIDNAESYIPLSMEFLAKENPDVIFIIMMGDPKAMEEKIQKELENNPAWMGCSAVKNNRVHILPYDLFTVNPGVRAIDAMKFIADKLYGAI